MHRVECNSCGPWFRGGIVRAPQMWLKLLSCTEKERIILSANLFFLPTVIAIDGTTWERKRLFARGFVRCKCCHCVCVCLFVGWSVFALVLMTVLQAGMNIAIHRNENTNGQAQVLGIVSGVTVPPVPVHRGFPAFPGTPHIRLPSASVHHQKRANSMVHL